jgi:hypothetical protein
MQRRGEHTSISKEELLGNGVFCGEAPRLYNEDLSSERAPQLNRTVTFIYIYIKSGHGPQKGAQYQDLLTDWSSVALWFWLWLGRELRESFGAAVEDDREGMAINPMSFETPACRIWAREQRNRGIRITDCSSVEMKVWLWREDFTCAVAPR